MRISGQRRSASLRHAIRALLERHSVSRRYTWRSARIRFTRESGRAAAVTAVLLILIAVPVIVEGRREASKLRSRVAGLEARLRQFETPDPNLTDPVLEITRKSLAAPVAPLVGTNVPIVSGCETSGPSGRPLAALVSAASAAVRLSAEDSALRLWLELAPTGVWQDKSRAPAATNWVDGWPGFNGSLSTGYVCLQDGRHAEAAEIFSEIVNAFPQWPYGHYYLGISTGDPAALDHARRIFERADGAGILTHEGRVYWAMTLFLAGNGVSAYDELVRLAGAKSSRSLSLGPLFWSAESRRACQRLMNQIPFLNYVRNLPVSLHGADRGSRTNAPPAATSSGAR